MSLCHGIGLHSTWEGCFTAKYYPMLPGRKSDQEISKSDFYQTIFLPKKTKSGPELSILRLKTHFFPTPNFDKRQMNFYLKILKILRKCSSTFLLYVEGRTGTRLRICYYLRAGKMCQRRGMCQRICFFLLFFVFQK